LKPFDEKGTFRPTKGTADLRRQAIQGAGVMVTFQVAVTAIQMIATVLLARLLAPTDFGIVAMVTTFSLLFQNFGFNGFTEATVQREDMNEALASNIFWIILGSGLLLTTAFAASGSLLGKFYHEPRLAQVATTVSATIILSGISVTHLALLRRAMCFVKLAANDLVARSLSVIVSIALGFAGWNYHALVAGMIAQSLSQSIGAFILCRWLPRRPSRADGTGTLVRFAINVYGNFGLGYVKTNIDNLLVGWSFGSNVLGLYKKAFDLFFLAGAQLFGPMAAVALPTLSRLRNEQERYRQYVLRCFSIFAFVGMGVGACLTIVGKDLILVLLGPKWEEAGKIFVLFGPGIGAMFLYAPWGWIQLSIGRSDRYFRWGVVEVTVTALLFLLGLHWGPIGVAGAWSISYWILALPATWYAGRPIGFGIESVIQVVWRYVVASVLAGVASRFIAGQIHLGVSGTLGSLTRVLTNSLIFGCLYLAAIILMHRGLEPLHQITRILRDLRPESRSTAKSPASFAPDGVIVAAPVATDS
jgi:O-antigen/teichoic acid export membrane protein